MSKLHQSKPVATCFDGEPADGPEAIEGTLLNAAARGGAFYAPQLLPFLLPHTSVDASGQVMVRIDNFVMVPDEAVAWLKEQPDKFGNLFEARPVEMGMCPAVSRMRMRG